MNQALVLPAPELAPTGNQRSKWDREYHAFLKLKPTLLPHSVGKFVAVHEGRIVGEGDDQVDVALRAYKQFGYVPIFVGLVSEEPQPIVRVPSPRVVRG